MAKMVSDQFVSPERYPYTVYDS